MNFRSNSEMARYYIEKLMEDGEEHSFPEITDYVMANSEGREIKGPLTIPIISNSVTKVICQGKGTYETTKRGCYRKIDAQVNGMSAPFGAYTRAMNILQSTKEELKSCFKIDLNELITLGHLCPDFLHPGEHLVSRCLTHLFFLL